MEQALLPHGDMSAIFGGNSNNSEHGKGSDANHSLKTGIDGHEASGAGDDERAPLNMRPKRVGRKLDTKEPESKRRAQNRAAQRAFRDRKERHLKELETRIQELEQESATWRNSSLMLRNQVTALEQELNGIRPQATRRTDPASDPVLDQSAPAFQQQMPSHQRKLSSHSSHSSHMHYPTQQSLIPPPDGLYRDDKLLFEPYVTPNTTSPVTPAQSAMGENPTPAEFCDELNLACTIPQDRVVTGFKGVPHTIQPMIPISQNRPMPKYGISPASTSNLHGSISGSSDHSNGTLTPLGEPMREPMREPTRDPLTQSLSAEQFIPNMSEFPEEKIQPPADVLNFSYQDQQPFDVFSFVNNESTLFDGFDLDAVWNIDGTATNPPMMGQGEEPQLKMEPTDETNTSPEIVPATNDKYITCTEVWDRICSRPKFGEIDIQGMCMELRAKAKCSDSGVVLPEKDVDSLLHTYK